VGRGGAADVLAGGMAALGLRTVEKKGCAESGGFACEVGVGGGGIVGVCAAHKCRGAVRLRVREDARFLRVWIRAVVLSWRVGGWELGPCSDAAGVGRMGKVGWWGSQLGLDSREMLLVTSELFP
jgi:hypothetical protein